jgi:Ca2+-binding RTX toxin-like protein
VRVASNPSNLESQAGGAVYALSYSIYDISGNLLGQFSSFAEGNVTIPTTYGNIGRIEIEAGTNVDARIYSVAFNSVNNNATTTTYPPEEITYTLTDDDGDSSSATLQLKSITNHTAGTSANNTLSGSAANDYISGLDGADSLSGGAGYDIIYGGAGNDTIDGGADNDMLSGGEGNDSILGGTGNDTIYGDGGADTLIGGDGNDLMYGGDGNDSLSGGLGSDTLYGGAGDDTLTGGSTGIVDVFKWDIAAIGSKGAPASDVVTDFDTLAGGSGGDVLDLRDLLVGEHSGSNLQNFLHFEVAGSDTIIHISSTGEFASGYNSAKEVQTITLQNVDLVGGATTDQEIIQNLLNNNKLITDA